MLCFFFFFKHELLFLLPLNSESSLKFLFLFVFLEDGRRGGGFALAYFIFSMSSLSGGMSQRISHL